MLCIFISVILNLYSTLTTTLCDYIKTYKSISWPYIQNPKTRSSTTKPKQHRSESHMGTRLCFLLIVVVSIPSFILSGDLNGLCNQTPYPDQCKHFMTHTNFKGKSDFKKMAIQVAMERALSASSQANGLGPKCRNPREKAAWADCLSLYEDTILQLNRTLDPAVKCSDFDAQTWLSAAVTNLETCRTGFAELGVSNGAVFPAISEYNVTRLISNTLALINNASAPRETYG